MRRDTPTVAAEPESGFGHGISASQDTLKARDVTVRRAESVGVVRDDAQETSHHRHAVGIGPQEGTARARRTPSRRSAAAVGRRVARHEARGELGTSQPGRRPARGAAGVIAGLPRLRRR